MKAPRIDLPTSMRGQVEQCIEPRTVEHFLKETAAELTHNSKMYYAKVLARLARSLKQDKPETYRELTRSHAETYLADLQELKSQKTYQGCTHRFFQWLTDNGKGPSPEVTALFKPQKRERFRGLATRQKPLPGTYTPEELREILAATVSIRDRAFFTVLYATGARISELLNAKMRDVELATFEIKKSDGTKETVEKMRLTINVSKTKPRVLPWTRLGVYELKIWLTARNGDPKTGKEKKAGPDEPLWITRRLDKEGKPRAATYTGMSAIWRVYIKQRYKAATGQELKGSPHWLRHTRLTELASNMTSAELCSIAGWTQASSMASVYVNASGVSGQNGMSRAEGEIGEPPTEISYLTRQCPQCGFEESKAAKFCSQCAAPLTKETKEQETKRQDERQTGLEALNALVKRIEDLEKESKRQAK